MATLAAMACRLSVLAANACTRPELVTTADNGDLFRPLHGVDIGRPMSPLWHVPSVGTNLSD